MRPNRNGPPQVAGSPQMRSEARRLLSSAYCLLTLDQNQIGMVNAALHLAGDCDEPSLGIQDFQ